MPPPRGGTCRNHCNLRYFCTGNPRKLSGGSPLTPEIMKIHVFQIFSRVWGGSEATRSIGESTATFPESMGSNRGLATPFSSILMFSGLVISC